jgi:hypothetical protein
MLDHIKPEDRFVFQDWLEIERELRENRIKNAKRSWKRFKTRSPEFWKETFGIMPEEIKLLDV